MSNENKDRTWLWLEGATIESAREGGSFVRFSPGQTLGTVDSGAIETTLRQLGAVWCRVSTHDTGYGDKVKVVVIFQQSPEDLRRLRGEAVAAARKPYLLTREQDSCVAFARRATIDSTPQRWSRIGGKELFVGGKLDNNFRGAYWTDTRNPATCQSNQQYQHLIWRGREEWRAYLSALPRFYAEVKEELLTLLLSK